MLKYALIPILPFTGFLIAGLFGKYLKERAAYVAIAGVGALGTELYTKYLLPFEIASIVLLVGLIGAVMLAKIKTKE